MMDIWFKSDISNILRAVNEVNRSQGDSSEDGQTYRRGFVDALAAVALALGLKPEDFGGDVQGIAQPDNQAQGHVVREQPSITWTSQQVREITGSGYGYEPDEETKRWQLEIERMDAKQWARHSRRR